MNTLAIRRTFSVLISLGIALCVTPTNAAPEFDEVRTTAESVIGFVCDSDTTPPSAMSFCEGNFGDEASAEATATLNGAIGARSFAGGAGGTSGPMIGTAQAGWTASYVVNGTGTVDVDFDVVLDGFLEAGNNNSGSDVVSSVELTIEIVTDSNTIPLYSGTAVLTETTTFQVTLNETGGLNGEGTLLPSECNFFGTCYGYSVNDAVEDGVMLPPGTEFSLVVDLITVAEVPGGFESAATSDFADTLTVTLSSDNPSATIQQVANPAPEPDASAVSVPLPVVFMLPAFLGFLLLRFKAKS